MGGSPERPPPTHPQHQQQVLQAVERAKQVTVGELNSLIGVSLPAPAPPWVVKLGVPGGQLAWVLAALETSRVPLLPGPCLSRLSLHSLLVGVVGHGRGPAPTRPWPTPLLSSSSSSSHCPTTPPLCPSPLARLGWWAAMPRGCWPCREPWPPRLSWPRSPRRTGQAWRPRGPEVSGHHQMPRAGGTQGPKERIAGPSNSPKGLQGRGFNSIPSGLCVLGQVLSLSEHLSEWCREGIVHPLQGCWKEKGGSELGRGLYTLWRALCSGTVAQTPHSISFSLFTTPPACQWREPRAG